jgi:hypothetical protein
MVIVPAVIVPVIVAAMVMVAMAKGEIDVKSRIPAVAMVAVAPVTGIFEFVARLACRIAAVPEAVDHMIEMPLSMVDPVVAILPTLGLRRHAADHRAA